MPFFKTFDFLYAFLLKAPSIVTCFRSFCKQWKWRLAAYSGLSVSWWGPSSAAGGKSWDTSQPWGESSSLRPPVSQSVGNANWQTGALWLFLICFAVTQFKLPSHKHRGIWWTVVRKHPGLPAATTVSLTLLAMTIYCCKKYFCPNHLFSDITKGSYSVLDR